MFHRKKWVFINFNYAIMHNCMCVHIVIILSSPSKIKKNYNDLKKMYKKCIQHIKTSVLEFFSELVKQ